MEYIHLWKSKASLVFFWWQKCSRNFWFSWTNSFQCMISSWTKYGSNGEFSNPPWSRWAIAFDPFFGRKPEKKCTPWKFNSSPLKISHPKRKGSSSNHHFSGAMLNFGGVCYVFAIWVNLALFTPSVFVVAVILQGVSLIRMGEHVMKSRRKTRRQRICQHQKKHGSFGMTFLQYRCVLFQFRFPRLCLRF